MLFVRNLQKPICRDRLCASLTAARGVLDAARRECPPTLIWTKPGSTARLMSLSIATRRTEKIKNSCSTALHGSAGGGAASQAFGPWRRAAQTVAIKPAAADTRLRPNREDSDDQEQPARRRDRQRETDTERERKDAFVASAEGQLDWAAGCQLWLVPVAPPREVRDTRP